MGNTLVQGKQVGWDAAGPEKVALICQSNCGLGRPAKEALDLKSCRLRLAKQSFCSSMDVASSRAASRRFSSKADGALSHRLKSFNRMDTCLFVGIIRVGATSLPISRLWECAGARRSSAGSASATSRAVPSASITSKSRKKGTAFHQPVQTAEESRL
jgi:hypothetical protein